MKHKINKKMNYNVSLLTSMQVAHDLAQHGDEVFTNDATSEFYTYEDVAAANLSPTVFSNTTITQAKADTLFLMEYDSVTDSYPIRKSRMFPRRPK